MAKRKNLFLPRPKWTLMRLLRMLVRFGVLAAIGAACWLGYFALTPVEVAPQSRHFNVDHGSSLRSVAEQFEKRAWFPTAGAWCSRVCSKRTRHQGWQLQCRHQGRAASAARQDCQWSFFPGGNSVHRGLDLPANAQCARSTSCR
jgi:hypothetical protein